MNFSNTELCVCVHVGMYVCALCTFVYVHAYLYRVETILNPALNNLGLESKL